eukprot:GHVQ01011440.1.p1 GENE.GHVQ01011440.1~~GHVQ01011440.1.p1  ORF type:complete len:452 (+),score=49.68 GHVQ01011440.1:242-1597(+)
MSSGALCPRFPSNTDNIPPQNPPPATTLGKRLGAHAPCKSPGASSLSPRRTAHKGNQSFSCSPQRVCTAPDNGKVAAGRHKLTQEQHDNTNPEQGSNTLPVELPAEKELTSVTDCDMEWSPTSSLVKEQESGSFTEGFVVSQLHEVSEVCDRSHSSKPFHEGARSPHLMLAQLKLGIVMLLVGADLKLLSAVFRALEVDLKLTPSQLSIAVMCGSLSGSLSNPIWAAVGGTVDRRSLLAVGCGLWGVCGVGSAFSTALWSLVMWRTTAGISMACVQPLIQTLLADVVGPGDVGIAFGFNLFASNMGLLLGGFVGLGLSELKLFGWLYCWRVAYVLLGLSCMSVCVMLCRDQTLPKNPHAGTIPSSNQVFVVYVRVRRSVLMYIVDTVACLASSMSNQILRTLKAGLLSVIKYWRIPTYVIIILQVFQVWHTNRPCLCSGALVTYMGGEEAT